MDSYITLDELIKRGGRLTMSGGDYTLPGPDGITYQIEGGIGLVVVLSNQTEDE